VHTCRFECGKILNNCEWKTKRREEDLFLHGFFVQPKNNGKPLVYINNLFLWDETLYNIVWFSRAFLVCLDFQQMKLVILFSDTLQNTLILTMRTLWATITESAGPGMLAWDSWSMMLILGVLCSGTSRIVCQGLSPHSLGMKVLCLSTAKIIQIFFSTCVDLNAVFCLSVVQRLRSLHTGMESGICKMRYALTKKKSVSSYFKLLYQSNSNCKPFCKRMGFTWFEGELYTFLLKGSDVKVKKSNFWFDRIWKLGSFVQSCFKDVLFKLSLNSI